jgi:hypothetical protein
MTDQDGKAGDRSSAGNSIAFGLIGALVLLFLISKCGADSPASKPPEADASPDGPEACALVPMEPIKVEAISSAYEANEAAAQKAYGDRCVLIVGIVEEVDLDMSDDPVIRLAGKDLVRPTVRLLDQASEQATFLAKGEETHFLCNEVSEFVGTPTFDGCLVVDPKAASTP